MPVIGKIYYQLKFVDLPVEQAIFAGNLARALGAGVTVLYVQSDEFLLEH